MRNIFDLLIGDRLVFSELATEIDLIVPDITSRSDSIKKYDIGLDPAIWQKYSCRK